MSRDFGIRISKPGHDVKTANPEDLAFSSKYKTFKIFANGSGTITHSARTVTIAHNLGYVPFFLVHTQLDPAVATTALVGDNTDFFISPFRLGAAIDTYEDEKTHDIIAWADDTNLYIKARDNVGKAFYPFWTPSGPSEDEVTAWESSFGYVDGGWSIGRLEPTFNAMNGAFRTSGGVSLTQGQSIYRAQFNLYIYDRGGSGQVKMTITGADVDNVVAFNSTPAFSNARTTASVSSNSTLVTGNSLGVDVKSIVEEIIGRGGWSSGNHIAIICDDNGTTNGNYYLDLAPLGSSASNLEIMTSENLVNYKYTIFLNQIE